jgi:hypothetical protein
VRLAGRSPAAEARFVRQKRMATGRRSSAAGAELGCTSRFTIGPGGWPRVGSSAPAVLSRMERDAVSASP